MSKINYPKKPDEITAKWIEYMADESGLTGPGVNVEIKSEKRWHGWGHIYKDGFDRSANIPAAAQSAQPDTLLQRVLPNRVCRLVESLYRYYQTG